MTPSPIKDNLNFQTCMCCMCRCGDHKCFQQLASKLSPSMQKDLVYDNRDVPTDASKKPPARQADLYRKTIYRQDYCDQPDVIDRFPLEHTQHRDNVKFNSTFDYPVIDSTYKDDFIPISREDQELCRTKLRFPDSIIRKDAGRGDGRRPPTKAEYNYYCPPHCRGIEKPKKKENCLLGHEREFNLGPPSRNACSMPERSPHPFAKYSNYMLDYRGSKIPPKRRPVKRSVERSQSPMASDTSYRDAFSNPPDMTQKPAKTKGPPNTLKVGDEPMLQESTSMLDYKDPDVGLHKPTRPARQVYQPPECSMETTTTTGRTYKRWEDLPVQVKPKMQREDDTSFSLHETDVRRLFSTYQEDYDGINSALCPCRVVEKYGPKVLEPHYSYRKSNSLHDMFCLSDATETRSRICPHG